jgi:dTMP kinase
MVKFLTVEGGEGVGKTSFLESLNAALIGYGIRPLRTREPGGTAIADQIRQIFMHPPAKEEIRPETELCLVSAGRAQHVAHVIRPALQRGEWVICDRFADSTRVYQGELRGLEADWIESMINATCLGLKPDLTILLDCPTTIALQRLAQRRSDQGEISRFDSARVDQHERIRNGFLKLAQKFKDRFLVIDAAGTVENSLGAALDHFRKEGWIK